MPAPRPLPVSPSSKAAAQALAGPSKWERTKQILWDSNLNAPIRGAYNLMNTPDYVLMGSGTPEETEAAAGAAFDAASGAMVGGSMIPKPKNALNMGIRAFHSSPYDFDRFDLSNMGKGEGAQVYTKGHYFAEDPKVSGQGGHYWRNFVNHRAVPVPERVAANTMEFTGFDRPKAINELTLGNSQIDDALMRGTLPQDKLDHLSAMKQRQEEALKLLHSGQPVGPRTYEVDINADPKDFIRWEDPMHTQPDAVKEVLSGILAGRDNPLAQGMNVNSQKPFAEWYRGVSRPMNQMATGFIPGRMESRMAEAGVPGVKYLDAMSRVRGNGTSNYVIYRDNIIDIVKKYGIAGLLAGGTGAGAMTGGADEGLADTVSRR